MLSADDTRALVARLVEETEEGRLRWVPRAPDSVAAERNESVDVVLEAEFNGRGLRVYELKERGHFNRICLQIIDPAGRVLWDFPTRQLTPPTGNVDGEETEDEMGSAYVRLLSAAKYQAAGVRDLFEDLLGSYPPAVQKAKREFDRAERGTSASSNAGAKLIEVIETELREIDEQRKSPSYSTPEWRELHESRLNEDLRKLSALKTRVKADVERTNRQLAPF